MTSDIIDRIDALVDEQLAAGEPEGGYESHAAAADPDPDYPRCPHCRRHWHGLRMTERIAHMYRLGQWDPVEDQAPPRPGYDFSQYADTAPATGPEDDRWPAAPRVHRAPPATARRRKARARG